MSPDGQWTGALASGEDRSDVDFGYTGTGSLGDLVWIDTNDDGVQAGANEPGIPGATIDVVWAGPSGDFSNVADNVPYTAVTDGSGSYLVPNLPGGSYQVDVDSATLPTGLTPTFDLDGGLLTPDGSWAGSLAAGQDKTDVDFGYRGGGTIGER